MCGIIYSVLKHILQQQNLCINVIFLLQSNFYLEQEEDQGHIQPMICDLCDQGRVASHLCTKCQMKLCFHCHSVHVDCCVQSTVSSQGKAADTSEDDAGKLLEKGKSQMRVMEKMLTRISEDEKELNKQRKSLEDNIHAHYTVGLASLADARDELLRSIEGHAEAQAEQFKTEMTSMQKKHDALSHFISQENTSRVSSAELQAAVLSDSDMARFQERIDQNIRPEFFRHKAADSDAKLLVKRLKQVVFGTFEICSDKKDFGVSDAADAGDFDQQQVSGYGEPKACLEVKQDLTIKQPHIEIRSVKARVDELAEKFELMMKKFAESESKGRKLLGENRSLLEEVRTFRDKNSILVQEVASLQGETGKLQEDVSKLQAGHQNLFQEYTSLLKQNANLSSNFADLQKQFHSLQTGKTVVSTADSTTSFRTEMDAVRQEGRLLKTDLIVSQHQIELLQRQVQSLQDSLRDKGQKVTRLESDMGELQDDCAYMYAFVIVCSFTC